MLCNWDHVYIEITSCDLKWKLWPKSGVVHKNRMHSYATHSATKKTVFYSVFGINHMASTKKLRKILLKFKRQRRRHTVVHLLKKWRKSLIYMFVCVIFFALFWRLLRNGSELDHRHRTTARTTTTSTETIRLIAKNFLQQKNDSI